MLGLSTTRSFSQIISCNYWEIRNYDQKKFNAAIHLQLTKCFLVDLLDLRKITDKAGVSLLQKATDNCRQTSGLPTTSFNTVSIINC